MTPRAVGRLIAALLCATLLAACASDPARMRPGTPRAQVLEALGTPSARFAAEGGGERLQYSRQPYGRQVYNVDLDANGRVLQVEQVLNEGVFPRLIQPRQWRRDDVLRAFGPPAFTTGARNVDGVIWVWRYLDGPFLRLLYVDIGRDGTVLGYSTGDEPLPDVPDAR